ncbi:hypothetical protein [Pelagibacterium lacus]|uniref:Uncharacterized protein n=1 Tax=Pelagibacterium lacus TaxID=2282655 RepID=A0A369VZS8_9HYPH|nr:hypothetical protein [Pelagibacterium lacus]RDE07643.1 hypothetical protein DVH29_15625 [Pelagibacterium lacus]
MLDQNYRSNDGLIELDLSQVELVAGGNPRAVASAARFGWRVGSAIYNRYDTQILDAIDWVLN